MKTRIATLIMVSVFFLTAAAMADNPPTTYRSTNYDPVYLGPPLELPSPLLLGVATYVTAYQLNDVPWEYKYAKKSFRPIKPASNFLD